ncbi:hypothetical protein [Candidatus Igneacidithiobacillus taiwanensis]|uniref:hypothetical protein n=1 Tax=Candidatus Igneacidithiobacillus taiwanensis TaxID=1945924 RepID=UPI0028967600|nr:hypothetical protein [Candidatus Igneacidithiobacillus taiwanensis]
MRSLDRFSEPLAGEYARPSHRCAECGGPIYPGEDYILTECSETVHAYPNGCWLRYRERTIDAEPAVLRTAE